MRGVEFSIVKGSVSTTLHKEAQTMRFTSHYVVALVTALVLSGEVRGQGVSVLLQKGIFAEETVGDLDAAIKIYQQILTKAQANR